MYLAKDATSECVFPIRLVRALTLTTEELGIQSDYSLNLKDFFILSFQFEIPWIPQLEYFSTFYSLHRQILIDSGSPMFFCRQRIEKCGVFFIVQSKPLSVSCSDKG